MQEEHADWLYLQMELRGSVRGSGRFWGIKQYFPGNISHHQRMKLSFSLVVACVVSCCLAASPGLQLPLQDSFYVVPDNLDGVKDGTILKSRPAPAPVNDIFFEVKVQNTWQLLVKSTDSHGNANAIVTTVFEPFNADPSKLVSYQTWEDCSNLDCLPSHAFLKGASITTVNSALELYWIQLALNEGYYVVSPDYEGPKSAFGASIQAGHATLDSVRAALSSGSITGINADAKVALWGYSGGSIPSAWAATLAPSYAPDLTENLIGAAIGGLVSNVTDVAFKLDGGVFAAFAGMGLAGLANEYPDFEKVVYDNMLPANAAKFNSLKTACLIPEFVELILTHWLTGSSSVISNVNTVIYEEAVQLMLQAVTLANGEQPPQIPVFLYNAVLDEVADYTANTLRVFNKWKLQNIKSLELAADAGSEHGIAFVTGAPAALTWIGNRFKGLAPVKGAVQTVRASNLLYPGISPALILFFEGAAKNIVGADIGPQYTQFVQSFFGKLPF